MYFSLETCSFLKRYQSRFYLVWTKELRQETWVNQKSFFWRAFPMNFSPLKIVNISGIKLPLYLGLRTAMYIKHWISPMKISDAQTRSHADTGSSRSSLQLNWLNAAQLVFCSLKAVKFFWYWWEGLGVCCCNDKLWQLLSKNKHSADCFLCCTNADNHVSIQVSPLET